MNLLHDSVGSAQLHRFTGMEGSATLGNDMSDMPGLQGGSEEITAFFN